jgi:hypothetical protein
VYLYAGLAIIAAMAPITWDFSSSPLSFLIFMSFLQFARFGSATVQDHHFRVFFEEGMKDQSSQSDGWELQ